MGENLTDQEKLEKKGQNSGSLWNSYSDHLQDKVSGSLSGWGEEKGKLGSEGVREEFLRQMEEEALEQNQSEGRGWQRRGGFYMMRDITSCP